MPNEITKILHIKASPDEVYDILVNSEKHTSLTGGEANVENKEGGSFSCFGGDIFGESIKLIPGQEIQQKWTTKMFPEGFRSDVTFLFEQEEGGTKLSFKHVGVPEEAAPMIEEGWEKNYWSNFSKIFT